MVFFLSTGFTSRFPSRAFFFLRVMAVKGLMYRLSEFCVGQQKKVMVQMEKNEIPPVLTFSLFQRKDDSRSPPHHH